MSEKWEGFTQEEIRCISNDQKYPAALLKGELRWNKNELGRVGEKSYLLSGQNK